MTCQFGQPGLQCSSGGMHVRQLGQSALELAAAARRREKAERGSPVQDRRSFMLPLLGVSALALLTSINERASADMVQ